VRVYYSGFFIALTPHGFLFIDSTPSFYGCLQNFRRHALQFTDAELTNLFQIYLPPVPMPVDVHRRIRRRILRRARWMKFCWTVQRALLWICGGEKRCA
jgi:hypothetical protein